MIPLKNRERFHYRLGRRLWRCLDIEMLDKYIFALVGQFILLDIETLRDKEECVGMAKLCLRAGERAVELSLFQTARSYITHGIKLLGTNCWRAEYDLTLALYNAAAEITYWAADFPDVHKRVNAILSKARIFEDTLRAHVALIQALGSNDKMGEAVHKTLVVLADLDIFIPLKPSRSQILKQLRRTRSILKGFSDENLLRLPVMNNCTTLASMQLLNMAFLYTYLGQMDLCPLISCKIVEMTVDHGLCAISAVGFSAFGLVVSGIGGLIEEGERYGQLALRMCDQFDAKAWFCRTSAIYYFCIHSWTHPLKEGIAPLKHAAQIGIETGDIEFAMFNDIASCCISCGVVPVPELIVTIENLCDRLEFYGLRTNQKLVKPMQQLLYNLSGRYSGNAAVLTGAVMDFALVHEWKDKHETVYRYSHVVQMALACLFWDYERAAESSEACSDLIQSPTGAKSILFILIFEVLTATALARAKKKKSCPLASKRLKFLKAWARLSPLSFAGLQFLTEAELAWLKGDFPTALFKFTCSVALSEKSGILLLVCIANERAALACLDHDDPVSAKKFYNEALAAYTHLGASAKVDHIICELRKNIN